jgi:hypothetical protein
MFYQRLLKLGKYHFCILSERIFRYRTDNVRAKCSKSRKWEKGSAERRNSSVYWLVCKMKLPMALYNVAVLHRMDDQYDSNCTFMTSL